MAKSFLRFPGGKSKHIAKILRYFKDQEKEYREPFIGGGSIYLNHDAPNAWINDIDQELADLWRLVKEDPEVLVCLIDEHTKVLDHRRQKAKIKKAMSLWNEVKKDVNNKMYPPGYRYLFLAKTCFSGVVTGGPTGGVHQNGNYNLTSRWAQGHTVKYIYKAHEKLQDCKITQCSWKVLVEAPGEDVSLYLDPPYLEKGKQCYRHSFSFEDHQEFAQSVTSCPHRWLVTVDNIEELVDVWKSHGVPEERMIGEEWKYSMDGSRTKNRIGKELFIMDEKSYEFAINAL